MRPPPRALLPAAPSPTWVLAAMPIYCALAAVFVFSPLFPMPVLRQVQAASDGWINATLILAILVGSGQLALLFGPGRQRPMDVGWRRTALPAGIATTCIPWLAMNGSTLLASAAGGEPLAWQSGWARGGLLPGALVAQLIGTALLEETVFRAWLWPQLAGRFARRMRAWPGGLCALLVSQAVFALLHVPVKLAGGVAWGEITGMVFGLFIVGIVFALLYAATRNLFFVVGLHALGNAPTLLAEPQGPPPTLVMLGVALLIAALWAWRHRSMGAPPSGAPAHA